MVRKEPVALRPERVSRAENPRSSGVWKRMPPNDWASPDCRARTPQLLDMLRKVEKRGVNETARRLKQLVGQIFRFAIVTGRAKRDPSSDLKEALRATGEPQRHRAMPLLELPTFLQQSETASGEQQTKLALKLVTLTFLRTTELRGKWSELENSR